ncbi:hypothetical protein [Nocardia terpenica]|uniref:Uncharacterized protein n=1 Tax=Nocardia terpenica TaxID=455432 RepID=A0A6G9Z164_9NOCA|nr:hypothetical protein [Nocardia terpenica]QIS19212.1 hypothetical protein F6W96_13845 [Nocardia terpenica]
MDGYYKVGSVLPCPCGCGVWQAESVSPSAWFKTFGLETGTRDGELVTEFVTWEQAPDGSRSDAMCVSVRRPDGSRGPDVLVLSMEAAVLLLGMVQGAVMDGLHARGVCGVPVVFPAPVPREPEAGA